jgi:transglutaminase/protease-like cytokinesis protein 3
MGKRFYLIALLAALLFSHGNNEAQESYHSLLWRDTLTVAEQDLYDMIYYAAERFDRKVTVSGGVSVERALSVLEAVRFDHPGLFWLDRSLTAYFNIRNRLVSVELEFNPEEDRIYGYKEIFDSITEKVLEYAMTLESDAEKVKFIHDWLIASNIYSAEAAFDQSAFSAIALGEAVCKGYALAFKYYMQRLNIPCAIITGGGDELHAWNLVRLDGEFYNIDVTWNRQSGDPFGIHNYIYFNASDGEMSYMHTRSDASLSFPAAAGTKYSFSNYGFAYGSDFGELLNIIGER